MDLIEWCQNSCEHGQPTPPLGDVNLKMWILSMWWTIWKARNDFFLRGQPLDPSKIIGSAHKMLQDPSCHYWQFSLRKDGDQSSVPTTISNKEDIITFMDAAYKTKEG
eukprot:TRINITY_DN8973_c0_g1_i4.p1 TRINITY_DN8973_c0_g1~~TRINITY_DN8973_c0_g1_i4.p1  ORF type:complete len:108 (+),score=7.69 TRINITY_DN8973_c0_g1_i4:1089-1412(+)